MSKLKSCPFCGRETVRMTNLDTNRKYYFGCLKCCCFVSFAAKSEKGAIEAYNTRAENARSREAKRTCHMELDKAASRAMCGPALRCDACSAAVPAAGTLHYCPSCGAKVTD